jgi:tetratricopeptide (TPR) repeat protein
LSDADPRQFRPAQRIRQFPEGQSLLQTGFFISSDGVLLTNYHVISGGSSYLAKTPTGAVYFLKGVVAIFEPMDIAKLQFFATEVPYLTLGRSFEAVEGQRVLVIGNPEGLEGTVSDGIISAFRDKRTLIQITASRAIAYYDLKQFDKAISDYTEAIRLYPNDAQLYEGRAIAYDNLNQSDKAISDLIEAIRLQPDLAATYEIRAIIYDKLGKSSEAAQDRKKAKDLRDKR